MKRISPPAISNRLPASIVLLVGWLVFLFVISDQPQPFSAIGQWLGQEEVFVELFDVFRQYNGYDKYLHIFFWSVLTILLWCASALLTSFSYSERRISVLFVAALLGSIDEWHQHFTPCRSLSLADWVADMTGVVVVLCVVTIIHRLQSQPPMIHP